MKRLRVRFHNFRFNLGWLILPGYHKHVMVILPGEFCDRCGSRVR